MTFADDLTRIVLKTNTRVDAVVKAGVLAIGTDLVTGSPVDTGRFRANWRAGLDQVDETTDAGTDKVGAVSIDRIKATADSMTIGGVVFMTNSLQYAMALEYGWSRHAPSGMVRVTAARASTLIDDAIRTAPT